MTKVNQKMKTANQIIEVIEFGKCKQEIEISFEYDKESTDNVSVWQHNYDNGKHIISRRVTDLYTPAMLQEMIDSVDVEQLVISEMASRNDDMFEMKDMLDDITVRPQVHPVMGGVLAQFGMK